MNTIYQTKAELEANLAIAQKQLQEAINQSKEAYDAVDKAEFNMKGISLFIRETKLHIQLRELDYQKANLQWDATDRKASGLQKSEMLDQYAKVVNSIEAVNKELDDLNK